MSTSDTDLILFAPDTSGMPWRWCRIADDGYIQNGTGWVAGPARRRILVVPGWSVATRRVRPQGKGRSRHTDALFLAEETVASDIDDLHAVVHPETETTSVVWLVDPEQLTSWIVDASQKGHAPDIAIPDYICLPDSSIYRGADTCILRDGLTGARTDRRMGLDDDVTAAAFADDGSSLKDVFTNISDTDALDRAMAAGARASRVSLLSGRFAPPGRWHLARRLWTIGATLTAASVLSTVALVYLEAEWFANAADGHRAHTEHVLSEAFPDASDEQISDPWSLARRMRDVRRSDFLALSGILTRALEKTPEIGVQGIDFDAASARMTVRIRFDSFRSIGALDQTMRMSGVRLIEGASRQDGTSRIGEITLVLAP